MPEALADRTVDEVNFAATYHVTLLAIKRGGELIMLPGKDLLLYSDDLLVIIGRDDDVRRVAEVE